MKRILIMVIIIVIVSMSILLFVGTRKRARLDSGLMPHPLPTDSTLNGQMLATSETSITSEAPKGHIVETTSQSASVASQALVFAWTLPTGLIYKTAGAIEHIAQFTHIFNAISNAVTMADCILTTKSYSVVTQFNRPVWLEMTDKPQATAWRIIPCSTTAVVAAIQVFVYRDETLTEKDPARSYNIEFIPETGNLRMFWWDDRHEILNVRAGNMAIDYARHLEGKKRLVMVCDRDGNMVSSNIYDWAVRGSVIGRSSHPKETTLPVGSTSAVEKVTGSRFFRP